MASFFYISSSMIIPNLPTDNLYKFIFLSGITIIIASAVLFVTQYKSLTDKNDTLALEVIVKLEEGKNIENNKKTIRAELDIIKKSDNQKDDLEKLFCEFMS